MERDFLLSSFPPHPSSQSCEGCQGKGRTPLCRLEPSAWDSFLRARALHEFKARQVIFHERTPASIVYILCNGEVKLSLAGSSGAAKIVRLVSAASSPCEILDKAALERPIHSVTCESLTRVQVACMEKPTFSWLVRQEPSFASLVVAALSSEVDWHVQTLRDTIAAHARERLAKALLLLADTHGKRTARGTEIVLPIRRRELAETLGFSRETVSRLLSELSRDRILTLTRQSICITALPRLKKLAGR